ncbi:hypothetical protein FRB95_008414 [Tulasnella sp. JGI-2019a]|nr:hypothetical protein FRB95_008414 [Tulasnella sp. JGI-2019a]
MDPLDPSSFNLKDITLHTGRKYEYCDQTPSEYNEGKTPILVLLHGFPESWYDWRHQIGPWVRRGWRVIIPSMLGYGGTDKPDDVTLYTPLSLAGEISGFLDALDIKQSVVVVGHDWGASVAWSFAARYPERTRALVSLSIPRTPPVSGPLTTPQTVAYGGRDLLGYRLFFDSPAGAAKIQSNIPLFIDMLYRSRKTVHPELFGAGTMDKIMTGKIKNPGSSDLMSREERLFYIKAFQIGGIDKPLNYYRTTRHLYAIQEELKLDPVLPSMLPALLIAPDHDPFASDERCEASKAFVPSLEVVRVDSAHYILLEKRDEVTRIVGDWVEKAIEAAK